MSVAIPCASLCINRRLYLIANVRSVTTTKAEKKRAIMVDLAIGVGVPIIQMILCTFFRDINYEQVLICIVQTTSSKAIVLISTKTLAASRLPTMFP